MHAYPNTQCMKNKKCTKIVGILCIVGLVQLSAQEAVVASGANSSGSGGSASISIGQIVYTSLDTDKGSISPGVQQPYEISSVASGIKQTELNVSITTYPNPTNDILNIKVAGEQHAFLSYHLFDMEGKLIEHQKLVGAQTSIQMEHLSKATYFLKVMDNQGRSKTIKIIKH